MMTGALGFDLEDRQLDGGQLSYDFLFRMHFQLDVAFNFGPFSAGARIEPVRVERRPYQFTYEDDLGMHFMHTETFEEIIIDKNLINNYDLMADGQIVEVMFHTDKEIVLSAELPPIVDMEVTYTEPGIKGDTASTNSLKPATVNTGATIKVPLFINTGDKIRVDTHTREYYERIR